TPTASHCSALFSSSPFFRSRCSERARPPAAARISDAPPAVHPRPASLCDPLRGVSRRASREHPLVHLARRTSHGHSPTHDSVGKFGGIGPAPQPWSVRRHASGERLAHWLCCRPRLFSARTSHRADLSSGARYSPWLAGSRRDRTKPELGRDAAG